MKILMLVIGLPLNIIDIKGGVHSAAINLLKGFATLDIEVRVLSFNKEIKKERSIQFANNIELIYCPEGNHFHSLNYFLNCPKILKKHIKAFDPDIIHSQAGDAFLLSTFFGIYKKKYVLTLHGMAYEEARHVKALKDKLTLYFNGFIQARMFPDNVIHICKYSLHLHRKYASSRYKIIPNAIDSSNFELVQKKGTSNHLLYIGVINERKNIMLALIALKELAKKNIIYSLTILGDFIDEPYKKKVLNYIKQNGLDDVVNFKGWVSQKIVKKYIEDTDIVLLPSKQETLPMVIAEAMAAGKVVISSITGGTAEMIQNGQTGFLFSTEDISGLIYTLEELYNNGNKINMIATAAKEEATKTYHCEKVAKKTFEFYKEILKES